MIQEEQIT